LLLEVPQGADQESTFVENEMMVGTEIFVILRSIQLFEFLCDGLCEMTHLPETEEFTF
jgi:hypothetical protein